MRHLGRLLRGRWFRRLFAVRVTSQLGDGVLQVALASYALFSPERQATAGAVAAALAVVLLPFSALGPFAGVFLDRWSRRQVLALGNYARVALAAALAWVVGSDLPDPVFYGGVLLCLSVNRFLLAGLSAALPHTLAREDLLTANALTPTAGTGAFVAGLGLGAAVRAGTPQVWDPDVAVLLAAALGYAVAGSLALRIPRPLLGPDPDPDRPDVRAALAGVLGGLVAGLRHLRSRPGPSAALGVIGVQRFWVGISSVALVLLHRNHLHPGDADAAFTGLATATLVAGAGFVSAALVTPAASRRWGVRRWVVTLLVVGAVVQVVPGALYTEGALLVTAFVLGLVAQGIKICVDTVVQAGVDDAYRGRVFSLYDVLFNVAFVAAAAVAAVLLPDDGRSYPVVAAVSAGHLVAVALCLRAVPAYVGSAVR